MTPTGSETFTGRDLVRWHLPNPCGSKSRKGGGWEGWGWAPAGCWVGGRDDPAVGELVALWCWSHLLPPALLISASSLQTPQREPDPWEVALGLILPVCVQKPLLPQVSCSAQLLPFFPLKWHTAEGQRPHAAHLTAPVLRCASASLRRAAGETQARADAERGPLRLPLLLLPSLHTRLLQSSAHTLTHTCVHTHRTEFLISEHGGIGPGIMPSLNSLYY